MSAYKGWAWGTTDSGAWLCIPGSYHARPLLADTPDAATPYPSNIVNTVPVLALVEHVGGTAFRIVELAGEAS